MLAPVVAIGYLMTIHESEFGPFSFVNRMRRNAKHRWETPTFLLHSIFEAQINDLFHKLSKIEGNLEDLEDDIFDGCAEGL